MLCMDTPFYLPSYVRTSVRCAHILLITRSSSLFVRFTLLPGTSELQVSNTGSTLINYETLSYAATPLVPPAVLWSTLGTCCRGWSRLCKSPVLSRSSVYCILAQHTIVQRGHVNPRDGSDTMSLSRHQLLSQMS